MLSHLSPDGTPEQSDILSVIGRFPVAGLSWWQDDWHAYRCCPYPHPHQGLDMFAETGTPLVAAADGTVTQVVSNSISGLGLEIQDAAGVQYYYAHLTSFAPGMVVGKQIRESEIVGYVGATGNAVGTSPHLHFEYQPGGVPQAPMPQVEVWLKEAEDRAFLLLEQSFPYAITPADLADWESKARALAPDVPFGAEGSVGEFPVDAGFPLAGGPDGGTGGPFAAPPGSEVYGIAPVAAWPVVTFAGLAFLVVLIGPGVRAGRRQEHREFLRSHPGLDLRRGKKGTRVDPRPVPVARSPGVRPGTGAEGVSPA